MACAEYRPGPASLQGFPELASAAFAPHLWPRLALHQPVQGSTLLPHVMGTEIPQPSKHTNDKQLQALREEHHGFGSFCSDLMASLSRLCGKQKACWQSFRNRRGSSSIVMTFKSLRRHNTSLLQVLLAVYLYQSSSRALRNKLLCKREVPHAWQLVGPKAGSWLARHSVASAAARGQGGHDSA